LWRITKQSHTGKQSQTGFEQLFIDRYAITNPQDFKNILSRLKTLRNNAAHPEGGPFTLEDAAEFFNKAERTLRVIGENDVADQFREIQKTKLSGETEFAKGSVAGTPEQPSTVGHDSHALLSTLQETQLARVRPELYEFLTKEIGEHAPLYLRHPQEMMVKELNVGERKIILPIPVTVLTRASQIMLSSAPVEGFSDWNAENDEYVQMYGGNSSFTKKKRKF
jgi:hypothetical protein